MQNSTIFYIVRHGETEHNLAEKIQGHADSPLTKNGVSQAQTLAETFKEIPFDQAFSSDLERAHRTAQILTTHHNIPVQKNPLLREMSFGKYEGYHIPMFREELGEHLAYRENLSDTDRFTHRVSPEIETDEEVMKRFFQFFQESQELTAGKKNLIVTHGAAMRVLLVQFGWTDYKHLPPGHIKNTAYAIIESDGEKYTVLETNGVEKLP